MAKRRIVKVWKKKEILRQRLVLARSVREIARSTGAGNTTVWELVRRAEEARVSWEEIEKLDEKELLVRLYGREPSPSPSKEVPVPDWAYIHKELKRKGVNRQLLWFEYRKQHPEGYSYSQFCELYNKWLKKSEVCMHQEHKAGEKMFVDFAGDKPYYQDRKSGKRIEGNLFVSVLGASGLVYAEATSSQKLSCWIEAHTNALIYFNGVPEIVVPDQTKTAVKKACFWEPELNRTYRDWAEYYDTCIIPARPRKPKDKAKVESAVKLAETWILARLRNRTFFSLAHLNSAIRELLEEINNRPLQGLGMSRRELYLATDKGALKPLKQKRFEFSEWKEARVNIDYHVAFDKSFYSVPYALVRERVEVRATANTVEIFFKSRRVASHKRSYRAGTYVTIPEHMPKEHREYLAWRPSRILHWAGKTGPKTCEFVKRLMEQRRYPELAYRSCMGIMRLGRTYGPERLEAACGKALALNLVSYKSIKSMLKSGFDKKPLKKEPRRSVGNHENIRGQSYYTEKGG